METDAFGLIIDIQDAATIRARTRLGATSDSEKLALDPTPRLMVDLFEEWLREGKITKRRELEVLGTLLYEAIFSGKVGEFFKKKLTEFEATYKKDGKLPPDKRLRVELVFGEATLGLSSLPWEFLFCPDKETAKGFFLSSKTNLVLSRYIPSNVDRVVLNASEIPLKILVVSVQPKSVLDRIDADCPSEKAEYGSLIEEIQKLKERVSPNSQQPLVQVKVLSDPTIETFIEQIRDYEPHVLHYIGHGNYDEKEKGSLCLLEENGTEAKWLSSETFAGLFERVQPRLVFLHLCQGPSESLRANFADLAPALIGMNIQAVVALRYPVKVAVARTFTKKFYDMLLRRESVASAVQEARYWITLANTDASLGSAVLYMRSFDGPILQETSSATPRPIAQSAAEVRPAITAAQPSDTPGLEAVWAALEKIAYLEAGRNGGDPVRVETELRQLRAESQGKGCAELRTLITNRMKSEVLSDAASPLVTIYSAMLNHLRGLAPAKT
jgi:CHAT domain